MHWWRFASHNKHEPNHAPSRQRVGGSDMVNRRTQGILLVGILAVAAVVVLAMALPWGLDHHHCKIDFPTEVSCTVEW